MKAYCCYSCCCYHKRRYGHPCRYVSLRFCFILNPSSAQTFPLVVLEITSGAFCAAAGASTQPVRACLVRSCFIGSRAPQLLIEHCWRVTRVVVHRCRHHHRQHNCYSSYFYHVEPASLKIAWLALRPPSSLPPSPSSCLNTYTHPTDRHNFSL